MQAPLISYIVSVYNQEPFIREAVESALAQTYSPMEIIIADDCSSDRTFDIVKELAASYAGPHRVVLHRNSRNLGIGGNLNQGVALAKGELFVLAAGDDISAPQRTTFLVRAWLDSDRKATSISSRFALIDKQGKLGAGESDAIAESVPVVYERGTIAGFLRRRKPHVTGCAYAIARKLFALFGPLGGKVTYEDTALCFRTVLLGGQFAWVDAPLVKYRRHSDNVTFALHQTRPRSSQEFEAVQQKRYCELNRFVDSYRAFAADARGALEQGLISSREYLKAARSIRVEGRRMELRRDLLVCGGLRRWHYFCQLYLTTIRPREAWAALPCLLPRAIHCAGVIGLNHLRAGLFKSDVPPLYRWKTFTHARSHK